MKVRDLIWRELVTIKPDASVDEAMELMLKKGIRSLLVEPAEDNEYCILTVRDIIFKVIARKLKPNEVKVSEVCSKPIITIDADKTVEDAVRIMSERNIARLVVVEGGKPIGMITLMDVMKASHVGAV